eukprot:GHVU01058732.1.p2 GENE.GHVU01058732.1~~GHVU01058732.1.p2  ORF type:complete len:187 (+),score=8.01 GHVU01058732.1:292-852(+)
MTVKTTGQAHTSSADALDFDLLFPATGGLPIANSTTAMVLLTPFLYTVRFSIIVHSHRRVWYPSSCACSSQSITAGLLMPLSGAVASHVESGERFKWQRRCDRLTHVLAQKSDKALRLLTQLGASWARLTASLRFYPAHSMGVRMTSASAYVRRCLPVCVCGVPVMVHGLTGECNGGPTTDGQRVI